MTISFGMLVKHPIRLGRAYRRLLNMKRSIRNSNQQRVSASRPLLGTFKEEDNHITYQSYLIPQFPSGSLGSYDRFVRLQGGLPTNLAEFFTLLSSTPPEQVGDCLRVVAHTGHKQNSYVEREIFQQRGWELVQSYKYSIWHAEAAARLHSVQTDPQQQVSSSKPADGASDGSSGTPKNADEKVPSREENLERISDILAASLPSFFTRIHNYSIYHKDVIFENRIRNVTTKGISNYSLQISKYKALGHILCARVKMDVLKITTHPEDNTVRVRWRIQMMGGLQPFLQFWKFFKRGGAKDFVEYIDGFSTFYVGDDGLVHKHLADKMMPDDETEKVPVTSKLAKLTAFIGLIGAASAAAAEDL